jgi:hypothetical protein
MTERHSAPAHRVGASSRHSAPALLYSSHVIEYNGVRGWRPITLGVHADRAT